MRLTSWGWAAGPVAARHARIHRPIFHAAVAVSAAGVIVKLAATLKEIAVAGAYGRSDAMDAFLAASLIPGLLVNLISESMNQALLPTLIRVRELEGHQPAQELLSTSTAWMCILLCGASAAMALTARIFFPLLAGEFPPSKLEFALRLFYALLLVVPVTGLASTCTAVLNTFGRFALPALAPVLIPITIAAAAFTVGARLGVWALVDATLAGSLLHALVVVGLMHTQGYKLRLRFGRWSAAAGDVARQYGAVLLSGVVASGGLLVDQSMAALLSAGSVSALVYGNRFVSVVIALLAGAISTSLTPYFSRRIAANDWAACQAAVRDWAAYGAAVSVPLAVLLIAGSHTLVRHLFQHGKFGPRDTSVVATVMAMYAIQIPFFVVSRVFYRFLLAMQRADLVLACGVLNLLLDIGLNLVLMRRMGVAGIALATSLWTVSTFLFLGYWTAKLLRRRAADTR